MDARDIKPFADQFSPFLDSFPEGRKMEPEMRNRLAEAYFESLMDLPFSVVTGALHLAMQHWASDWTVPTIAYLRRLVGANTALSPQEVYEQMAKERWLQVTQAGMWQGNYKAYNPEIVQNDPIVHQLFREMG